MKPFMGLAAASLFALACVAMFGSTTVPVAPVELNLGSAHAGIQDPMQPNLVAGGPFQVKPENPAKDMAPLYKPAGTKLFIFFHDS